MLLRAGSIFCLDSGKAIKKAERKNSMNQKILDIIRFWQRKRGKEGVVNVRSDVLGSYTGTPEDKDDDQPVQDADDL